MRSATFQIATSVEFVTEECCNCGVIFAITRDHQASFLRTKQWFYCPNGHRQSYTESEADRLKRRLAETERAVAWEKERAASLDKQLTKERKASARLKRRVSVGVCPCCQRTVSQLARHMQTKHPEFVKAAAS